MGNEKKWKLIEPSVFSFQPSDYEKIINQLLKNRGVITKKARELFINPPSPETLTSKDVGIDSKQLKKAIKRIKKAIEEKESIVVYTDYDADGISGGAVMWETIHKLGGKIMPYVPHRETEGYGFSLAGIDNVIKKHKPALIISVDHGITAVEKIRYAQEKGVEVIVTDHHVIPKKTPDCTIVHTTKMSGAGIAYFVAKELLKITNYELRTMNYASELLALAAIGTVADLVPLVGPNRSIARFGLEALNSTERVGLLELISEAGLKIGKLGTYDVSHIIAPRINAMGRLTHGLDALRLLCTQKKEAAFKLAQRLSVTNRERQDMTFMMTEHAIENLKIKNQKSKLGKLLFISHTEYNQGVIGLIAGKLVERYWRPAIVVSQGEEVSIASARSISGFNIIEAIRSCADILVDAGGHPMAAGFTVETARIFEVQKRLQDLAEKELTDEHLERELTIDCELPLAIINNKLWQNLQQLEPFGVGNPRPVFMTTNVIVVDAKLVGREKKHLKLKVQQSIMNKQQSALEAIGFNMGEYYPQLDLETPIDIVYSLDMNEWKGNRSLQLKLKDMRIL